MASDMATAEDRGEKRGRAEEKLAIAQNMMKRNRPIEDILEDTGLTRKEVENLSVNTHH
jgi:predicted transposase/invertase (TIGR01784 family)